MKSLINCYNKIIINHQAMKKINSFAYWLPRFLAIIFIVFISFFAFDVFGEGYSLGAAIGAFIIHLVPTFVLIIVLLIAWQWPEVGGVVFLGIGVFYLILISGKASEWGFLIIAGPVFLTGILFLFQNYFKKK